MSAATVNCVVNDRQSSQSGADDARPAGDPLAIGWFRLAAERGDSHAQRVLDKLLRNGEAEEVDNCRLKKRQPDRSTIDAWVRALVPVYGIDADLVLGLIEVESRFNVRARSPKNARGLMQLMPATARRFGVRDIRDPAQNLTGGMAYLRWLLDRYQEDISYVLAIPAGTYNARPYSCRVFPA